MEGRSFNLLLLTRKEDFPGQRTMSKVGHLLMEGISRGLLGKDFGCYSISCVPLGSNGRQMRPTLEAWRSSFGRLHHALAFAPGVDMTAAFARDLHASLGLSKRRCRLFVIEEDAADRRRWSIVEYDAQGNRKLAVPVAEWALSLDVLMS